MARFFASRLDDNDGTAAWLRGRFGEFFDDPAVLFPWFFDAAARRLPARRGVPRYRLGVARKVLGHRVFRRPAPA